MLLLATFVTPLTESFDRWDLPGIANDTEFAIFVLVLMLCLVLLVSWLLSAFSLLIHFVTQPCRPQPELSHATPAHRLIAFFIPPLSPPPLRI
jgi:hypothetical protein